MTPDRQFAATSNVQLGITGPWAQVHRTDAGVLLTQKPILHRPPPDPAGGQTFPHAPQLFASVWRSVQTPLQKVSPGWHTVVHTPATHVWVLVQVLPQVPQLLLSVCGFVQVPAQTAVDPAGQQLPLLQSPAEQTFPQVPQLFASDSRSRQN